MTLSRFHQAQQGAYHTAYAEIKAGKKTGHWIWYIFPQLETLGRSENARFYGIHDFAEACDYLNDPLLFNHYLQMVQLVQEKLEHGIPIEVLMGGQIDAQKLSSSLTLFQSASSYLAFINNQSANKFRILEQHCNTIINIISNQGYRACPQTLADYSVANRVIGSNKPLTELTQHANPPTQPPKRATTPPGTKGPLEVQLKQAITPVRTLSKKVAPPSLASRRENATTRLTKDVVLELERYITQRDQEPGYWFQGLFQGFSKIDKLKAAISLRLALENTVGKNTALDKIIKRNGLNFEELCNRDIQNDLNILSQGRLGNRLRQFSTPDHRLRTVRELVQHLLDHQALHSVLPAPSQRYGKDI